MKRNIFIQKELETAFIYAVQSINGTVKVVKSEPGMTPGTHYELQVLSDTQLVLIGMAIERARQSGVIMRIVPTNNEQNP